MAILNYPSKFLVWLEGIRYRSLIASISPLLIGILLSAKSSAVSSITILCLLCTALFIQIGTNLANDYFDYQKGADKKRIGPRRILQAGLVSPKEIKGAIFLTFSLASLCCFYLIHRGGLIIAFLLLLAIIMGIFYTGGPYPLAYIGLGDLFVFLFFGPIATFFTVYLLTDYYSPFSLFMGIPSGALGVALLTVNNLRDRLLDKEVSKKTLPVRFGHQFGVLEYAFSLGLATFVPLFLAWKIPSSAFCLFSLLPLCIGFKAIPYLWKEKDPNKIAPYFPKTAKLYFQYSLLFAGGLLLAKI